LRRIPIHFVSNRSERRKLLGCADPSHEKASYIAPIKTGAKSLLQKIGSDDYLGRHVKEAGPEGMDHGKMSRRVTRKYSRTVALDHPVTTGGQEAMDEALPSIPAAESA
jgi:hypothetical protein